MDLEDCPWLNDRLETWADRQARMEEEEAEHQRYAEEMARAPVYDFCERCGGQTEKCKGSQHRGHSHCMACGGRVGDAAARLCVNCLDLPYREKREKAIGEEIMYLGEEPI